MAFWFKPKSAPNAPSVAPDRAMRAAPARAAVQNKATLARLGCLACPLNHANIHTPKMKPTLAHGAPVYILAEAPGKDEDEVSGSPLTGPSGKLLRECLPEGVEVSFDNVVNCRPPVVDKTQQPPTLQEIECCRPRRIKWIEEAKPRLILGLGAVPLKLLLDSTDLQGMRGRLFLVKVGNHTCWFLPTYHPAFILRTANDKRKPLNSRLGHCFRMDVCGAFDLANRDLPRYGANSELNILCFDGTGPDHFGLLAPLLKQAAKAPLKAIDIETKGLRPYSPGAAIVSIALSFDNTDFAFAVDHPKSGWTSIQRQLILSMLETILKDNTTKIAHNVPFELEWFIWLYGKNVVNHAAWECTQMQAHFLDERRGKSYGREVHRSAYQSLDLLTRSHFGVSYKGDFKLNKRDMSASPIGDVLTYNGCDTRWTLRLYHHQDRALKQEGIHKAYLEALPRQASVALMQTLGVSVDQLEVKRLQSQLTSKIEAILYNINDLSVVKDFIKKEGAFNPLSVPDTLKIFGPEYLDCPEINVKIDKSKVFDFDIASKAKKKFTENPVETKLSVDKHVLDQITHPLGRQLARWIIDLRNQSKLKSTYVDGLELGKGGLVYPDGKLHCNFNTTFTETGRTSCVAEWSEILTGRGLLPIRRVEVGDFVWTHKGRWRKVRALWRKGVECMFNIYFSDGQILTCTKKHRLLYPTGRWATVGEIYAFFKEMGQQPEQRNLGTNSCQKQRIEVCGANCGPYEYQDIKHKIYFEESYEPARIQSVEDTPIFVVEDGRQEPNEGESFGSAPQLERGVPRWARVPYYKNKDWQEICSPCGSGESSQFANDPERLGSSSHRRKSAQQSDRQLSIGNRCGPHQHSQQTAPRFSNVEIEKIEIGGSHEVFDITVDEDASYLSCGVFSHNSDEPNMQNFPQRQDSWVRKQVVPEAGHVLVACDYGQLEGCTSAICSKDKALVDALWKDYDIHMDFAEKVAAVYPPLLEGKDMKKLRSVVKNKFVFPAIFGATSKSIAGYLGGIPENIAEDLLDVLWDKYYGLKAWQDATMKIFYEKGYVESPTGRRHRYPLSRNQVINFPIQSVACDIVCSAMNELSYMARNTDNWNIHPRLNIHDDLTFSVLDNEAILEASLETIYKTMLSPPFDFINVPLSVKVSAGYNWYEMTEIGQFWSHKDV